MTQAYWHISNSLHEYLNEDLTLSRLNPATIKFKKLENYSVYSIQKVGTDHFLAIREEGQLQWTPTYNESCCQWRIYGGPRNHVTIMAAHADLGLRDAPRLGFSDDKRLILQNHDYPSWYLTPTTYPYYAFPESKLESPAP
jgi:hypothetical protein